MEQPAGETVATSQETSETAPLISQVVWFVEVSDSTEPFVGDAGALLEKMISAMNLKPGQALKMTLSEAQRLMTLQKLPRVLVIMSTRPGVNASDEFKGFSGLSVVTHHPRALIENPGLKRECWEDLKKVSAFLDQKGSV